MLEYVTEKLYTRNLLILSEIDEIELSSKYDPQPNLRNSRLEMSKKPFDKKIGTVIDKYKEAL